MIHDSDMPRTEKQKIRSRTAQFIKRHQLKMPCQICQNDKSIAHHQDYAKAYDINFLCEKHHWAVHNGEIKEPDTVNLMTLAKEKGSNFHDTSKKKTQKYTNKDTGDIFKSTEIIEPLSISEMKFVGMSRAVNDAKIRDSIKAFRNNGRSMELEKRISQVEEIMDKIEDFTDEELEIIHSEISTIYKSYIINTILMNK